MYTSVSWMNEYLDPSATAQEQGELLTQAGFPLEGSEPVTGGDVRQDFEMISNRGDCVYIGGTRDESGMASWFLAIGFWPEALSMAGRCPANG